MARDARRRPSSSRSARSYLASSAFPRRCRCTLVKMSRHRAIHTRTRSRFETPPSARRPPSLSKTAGPRRRILLPRRERASRVVPRHVSFLRRSRPAAAKFALEARRRPARVGEPPPVTRREIRAPLREKRGERKVSLERTQGDGSAATHPDGERDFRTFYRTPASHFTSLRFRARIGAQLRRGFNRTRKIRNWTVVQFAHLTLRE